MGLIALAVGPVDPLLRALLVYFFQSSREARARLRQALKYAVLPAMLPNLLVRFVLFAVTTIVLTSAA